MKLQTTIVLLLCAAGCCQSAEDHATPPPCVRENAAVSCRRILSTFCDRVVACCAAAGPGVCVAWAYSPDACAEHYRTRGVDCSAPEWTNATMCRDADLTCIADTSFIACSDITGGTFVYPQTCE